jgi:hypothetical protein
VGSVVAVLLAQMMGAVLTVRLTLVAAVVLQIRHRVHLMPVLAVQAL